MNCQFASLSCTGTYTEDCCDECAKLEGDRCMSKDQRMGGAFKAAKTACVGPFKQSTEWRCVDCGQMKKANMTLAMLDTMRSTRQSKRKWQIALPVVGKIKQVYDQGDWADLTPAAIDNGYAKELLNGAAHEWCPWVKIGNLYTTVTTGNDAGWRLLVQRHIQPFGATPLVVNVFTGRHGNPEGTITENDYELFTDKVMDPNHYLQDIIQKAVADGAYAAQQSRPTIKLWDVGTTQGSTMTKTLKLATECLRNGEVVIFAWCWSLLSFYKVTVKEAMAYSKYDLGQGYNQTIKQIIKSKYGWANTAQMVGNGGLVHTMTAKFENQIAANFKDTNWHKNISMHSQKTNEVLKKHFKDGITASRADSQKASLSDQLKGHLNSVSPVHYH